MKRIYLFLTVFILYGTVVISQPAWLEDLSVTDYDGNEYKVVKIGEQWWMAENLRTTHYADGTPITLIDDPNDWYSNSGRIGAFSYYDDDSTKADSGVYYNREAAIGDAPFNNEKPSGVQGVCPDGWHLPSEEEWFELEKELGLSSSQLEIMDEDRGTNQGSQLAGTGRWSQSSALVNDPSFGSTGFKATPNGYRDGTFKNYGKGGYWWTYGHIVRISHQDYAYTRAITENYTSIQRQRTDPDDGLSVRCVSDTALVNFPILSLDTIVHITCGTCSNGKIQINAEEGNPPFSYKWSTGSRNQHLLGISEPGTYKVTVTDSKGISVTDSFEVKIKGKLIDERDGQEYKTINIGDQIWMAENLNAKIYADSTPIPYIESSDDWDTLNADSKAMAYYGFDSTSYQDSYGALYTWNAAMNGAASSDSAPSGVQGVCPDGWHLPSISEWDSLISYLGEDNAGTKLAGDAELWTNGDLKKGIGFGSTEFNALPAGWMHMNGTYYQKGEITYMWTSEDIDNSKYGKYSYITREKKTLNFHEFEKNAGFSVRCLKSILRAGFSADESNGATPFSVIFADESKGEVTSWQWDFNNDGIIDDSVKNPTFVYDSAGTYTVKLTVSDGTENHSVVKRNYITVNEPAEAEFSANNLNSAAPLSVTFTDSSTGDVSTWSWDFGDGNTSTEQNPNHTYSQAGTYTVSLTVTGDGGSDTETKTDFITVVPTAPIADFTAFKTNVETNSTPHFSDNSTGDVSTWLWDFGDGNTSTEQNPSHKYSQAGTYTVSLTVTNAGGSDTETKTDFITVTLPPPIAFFDPIDLNNSEANSPIIFKDKSRGGVTTWLWDFGDGNTSTEQNPSHTYNQAGTYSVSLTVTYAALNDSNTYTTSIDIIESQSNSIYNNQLSGMRIYPNPAENFVNIEGQVSNYDVSVYSITGKNIFTSKSSGNNIKLDISNIEKGMYYIKINSNGSEVTYKVIKQ